MNGRSRSHQEQSWVAEPSVAVLNDLICVCRDGYNGYLEAAEGIASPPYKTMFAEYAHQRDRFSADLANFILELGGAVTGTGSMNSDIPRGWLNIRAATTNGDSGTILAECERSEDMAKQAYERALEQPLPENIHEVVQNQYELIIRAHDRILDLRNVYLK